MPNFRIISGAIIILGATMLIGHARPTTSTANSHKAAAQNTRFAGRIVLVHGSLARTFKTWGSLKGAATLIVVGTAGSQNIELDPSLEQLPDGTSYHLPWTATTIQVERVLKGSQTGLQTVLVRQRGSLTTENPRVISEDFPLLTTGQRYLLFLVLSEVPGEFYPTGSFQGVFSVNAEGGVNPFTADGGTLGVPVHNAPLAQTLLEIQMTPDVPQSRQ